MRLETFHTERVCEGCGERIWGTRARRFCEKACQQRAWRAARSNPFERGSDLPALCAIVMKRADLGGSDAGKLLPRLFRAVARELRLRGWDPIELLMTHPQDPASDSDTAPGGIEGQPPARRKWLYPPELEIEKLDTLIAQRLERGEPVSWQVERREQIAEYLVIRNAGAPPANATQG